MQGAPSSGSSMQLQLDKDVLPSLPGSPVSMPPGGATLLPGSQHTGMLPNVRAACCRPSCSTDAISCLLYAWCWSPHNRCADATDMFAGSISSSMALAMPDLSDMSLPDISCAGIGDDDMGLDGF